MPCLHSIVVISFYLTPIEISNTLCYSSSFDPWKVTPLKECPGKFSPDSLETKRVPLSTLNDKIINILNKYSSSVSGSYLTLVLVWTWIIIHLRHVHVHTHINFIHPRNQSFNHKLNLSEASTTLWCHMCCRSVEYQRPAFLEGCHILCRRGAALHLF